MRLLVLLLGRTAFVPRTAEDNLHSSPFNMTINVQTACRQTFVMGPCDRGLNTDRSHCWVWKVDATARGGRNATSFRLPSLVSAHVSMQV